MKKILIVDDSKIIRNVLKMALIDHYELVEAENGQEALEKSTGSDIAFFLLDVNMPVMDGITLVRKLRSGPEYAKTPIVMLTTESAEEKKQQGKEAGANGWIVKPCEPDDLLGVIKKMTG